MPHTLLVVI